MPGRIPSRSLGVFASRSKPIAPRSRVPQALQHSPSTSSRSFSSTSCSYKPLETQGNAAPGPSFTTINADEISHFSRLSSEWWNTKGEFGLLHRMNPPRVEYIRQKLVESERQEDEWSFETRFQDREKESKRGVGKWLAGKRCLDVGCGGGLLSESLARLGGDVIGVDASESNIKIANLHASSDPFLPYTPPIAPVESASSSPSAGSWFSKATNPVPTPARSSRVGSLEYRHTSAESLRDRGEKFDVVCAMEVVEHVDEPAQFMKCLGDMVKPGGHLILSTISRTPLSKLLTITLAEDVLRLVTPKTHTYSKYIQPGELVGFVNKEMGGVSVWERNELNTTKGQEVGEVRGIVYVPWRGEWVLWSDVEGTWTKGMGELCNYMFHAKKRKDAA